MEQFLIKMLEEAPKSKEALRSLKQTALRCKMFEFAAKLRDMERELFPESEEVTNAKKIDEQARTAFQMVNVGVKEGGGWLLFETALQAKKMKGKFSMDDAIKILMKWEDIFGDAEIR